MGKFMGVTMGKQSNTPEFTCNLENVSRRSSFTLGKLFEAMTPTLHSDAHESL